VELGLQTTWRYPPLDSARQGPSRSPVLASKSRCTLLINRPEGG